MLHVALWEPEIPPNTGNIARFCAATGTALHLIGRLGFRLDDRDLKRAGCDYWPSVDVRFHDTLEAFEATFSDGRIFCLSARATKSYTRAEYRDGDCLMFGSESRGLPPEFIERHASHLFVIPMPTGKVRSLNLATAAGIVLYEALRQVHNWQNPTRGGALGKILVRLRAAGGRYGSRGREGGAVCPVNPVDARPDRMNAVVALPTRDKLRLFVRQSLCDRDQLDWEQTPFFEARITRGGRTCGLYFEIHGPRLVRSCAIWVGDEHRILFYDSTGLRYNEIRLSEAPDPLKLKDDAATVNEVVPLAKSQAA